MRKGELEAEDEHGHRIVSSAQVYKRVGEWAKSFDKRIRSRDALKLVLSAPPGSDPAKVNDAARSFLASEFKNHRYIFVLHTDKPHPHVHACITMRDEWGSKLDPRKADLKRYRERWVEHAEPFGIDMAATPRREQKRSAAREYMKRKGVEPNADRRYREHLLKAADGDRDELDEIAEQVEARRQSTENTVAEYYEIAEQLRNEGDTDGANLVGNYAESIKPEPTRAQEVAQEARRSLDRSREHGLDMEP